MGVSWKTAFKAALTVLVYSALWLIVGGFLASFGMSIYYIGIGTMAFGPVFPMNPYTPYYYAVAGVILAIGGLLIASFGFISSLLKVQTEIVLHEIEKRNGMLSPS